LATVSKFEEIKAGLRRAVEVEKLPPGTRLPSIRALADEHGVSLETAARAVRELRQEGLVDTRPGLGTFVTQPAAPVRAKVADGPSLRLAWGERRMGVVSGLFLEDAVGRFRAAHPGVELILGADPSDADIWVTTGSYVQTEAEAGRVLALDEIAGFDRAAPPADAASLAHEGVALYERSGHLYGLPYYVSPVVIWVSPEAFRAAGVELPRAGWSRDEFLETVRRLAGALPEGSRAFELNPDLAHLMPWLLGAGGDLAGIASAERAADWAFLREIARLGAPLPPRGDAKAHVRFAEGRLAMHAWGGRFEWQVRTAGGGGGGGEPPVALPYPSGASSATFLMSEAFAIGSRCAHPELALELVRELVSLESQRSLVAAGLRFPSHSEALSDLFGSAPDGDAVRRHWDERLNAVPDVMRLGAVRVDVIGHALRPLWGSEEPLDEALAKAAAACEAVLASYEESRDEARSGAPF